ncbi:MAG: hypothetical protein ACI9G1_005732 [Pirellulaceae bacterium]|jgi:hypothetical protein
MESAYNKFTSTLVYQSDAIISSIQADIDQIRQFDKEKEGKQRVWGASAIVAVVTGVALFLLGVMMEQPILVAGTVLGAVTGIACGIMWWLSKGYNVDDDRYQLLSGILRLISADTAKDAPVNVNMDLRRPDHKTKYTRKGTAGHWNVNFYEDSWLNLRGKLLDGASYNLVLIEKFQARSRWKTSRSGKSKRKTKTKTATGAILRIKPKAAKHGYLENLSADVATAVKLPNWVELKSVTMENGVLVL